MHLLSPAQRKRFVSAGDECWPPAEDARNWLCTWFKIYVLVFLLFCNVKTFVILSTILFLRILSAELWTGSRGYWKTCDRCFSYAAIYRTLFAGSDGKLEHYWNLIVIICLCSNYFFICWFSIFTLMYVR